MRRLHAPTLPNEQLHPLVQLGALPCHPNSGAERPFYSLNDTSERHGLSRYAVATILKGNRDER